MSLLVWWVDVKIERACKSMTSKQLTRLPSLNLAVEEENLAAIPFAILERRLGKKVSKLELKGTKVLPDGTLARVTWQVQGNVELGLPTEQDLDIFVALGVLTYRNNLSKTVTFTGREIAKILQISSVHGKFYQRLKLAMDRFIPLRFRAIAETDEREQVKWSNVFQEASFMVDKTTGRCTGSVTWTDKLVQSMDRGFFRVLDAGRYMGLDGITAKHLYRFLVVAFEETDLVLTDARKLCTEHLGILNPPRYLSRLMQTLEPAFDQLMRIEVVGSYHIVSSTDWRIALHRHPNYVPERKALSQNVASMVEFSRERCRRMLEDAGIPPRMAVACSEHAQKWQEFYALARAGNVMLALTAEGVTPNVALELVRPALEAGAVTEGRDILDTCEIALEICRQKKRSGQKLNNAAGLLVKIARDPETRQKVINEQHEAELKQRFRKQEEAVARREQEAEEKNLVLEYEKYRQNVAARILEELPQNTREAMRKVKAEALRESDRYQKMRPEARESEADALILNEIARKNAPPFEKWLLRQRVQQAVLPFLCGE
jgi:hypothetical protein